MNELNTAVKRATTPTPTSNPTNAPGRPRPSTPPPATAGGADIALLLKIALAVMVIVAAFFIYQTTAMKSEVTKAKNESIKLQSQSDNQRRDLGVAEAKARDAAQQATQLQVQADQAKTEAASAKANAEKAVNEAASLRTQLDQAKRQVAEAKAGADKAAAQVTQLQAQLEAQAKAKTEVAPAVKTENGQATAPKPVTRSKPLPLNATFKKAPMLDGNALLVQNTSTASLSFTVKFSNATDSKDFPVTLAPGASKEMGWLGAWVLAAGDKIEITSPGYDPLVKTAP